MIVNNWNRKQENEKEKDPWIETVAESERYTYIKGGIRDLNNKYVYIYIYIYIYMYVCMYTYGMTY